MCAEVALSEEQRKFLEECNYEFSDRYTDRDLEYKKVYDEGIPDPPILDPYYPARGRFNNHRDRQFENRRYQDYSGQNRGYKRKYEEESRESYHNSNEHEERNRDFNRHQRPDGSRKRKYGDMDSPAPYSNCSEQDNDTKDTTKRVP